MNEERNKRSCYCGLWQKNPEFLEKQNIPPGFCGFCSVCHKPGHTRHFPGASPSTGTWCDFHYRLVLFFHPLAAYWKYLWRTVIIIGLLLYWYLPRFFK